METTHPSCWEKFPNNLVIFYVDLTHVFIQPLEYLNTAKELGNQLENVKNNENLLEYLTQVSCILPTIFVFTIF